MELLEMGVLFDNTTSALDREMMFWRLEDQETRLSPRNTT
jgi:hypothetical protein